MKILRSEKGFALAFVLILAVIALGMTLAMLFMVGRGSFVSGQQKSYRTAVEASRGGMEAMFQLISSRGLPTTPFTNQVLSAGIGTKLAGGIGTWGGLDNSMTINPAVSTTYDMRIDLGAYRVYSKVVDTVDGNSGADEGLLKTAVVNSGSGEVTVVSVPYLYTIEVLSERISNPTERSKISVLYQY
ncbi:MAG: hypothetical protein C3F14_08235 [Deltaproteobacteria bacterium]|nr:MAG: hypothetical protein C3F14_08235 [Deltaproteobacteria bacterium]